MSKQNEIQDFPQNNGRAKKEVIIKMGNNIGPYHWTIIGFKNWL